VQRKIIEPISFDDENGESLYPCRDHVLIIIFFEPKSIYMMNSNKTVVVLGASAKKERYSNQAVKMLQEYGYKVIPVNPVQDEIHGVEVVKCLTDIEFEVHTLTMYVNSKVSLQLTTDIMRLRPERVIFNPGTENNELENICQRNKIRVIKACTLVLLRTEQFDEI
jgi:hypothetical protein